MADGNVLGKGVTQMDVAKQCIDLTMEMYDGLQTYPTGAPFRVIQRWGHEWSAPRYLYPASSFGSADRILVFSEHTGTHVDAPFHFLPSGKTIDEFPCDYLWGPASLVDASERDPSTPITAAVLEAAAHSSDVVIAAGDILLVRAWAGNRADPGFYECMAFSQDATDWLISKAPKAVGVDLPAVDSPGDRGFPVHIALLEREILIIENLVNLENIGCHRFEFVAIPLRLTGGTASPIRAVAYL